MTFPAEWEEHDSLWITWSNESYWGGEKTGKLVLKIIKSLSPFVKVKVIVASAEEQEEVTKLLSDRSVKLSQVEFVMIEENDRWLRDMGPIFLKNKKGEMQIADFKYNFYGEFPLEDPFCVKVDRVHKKIATDLNLSLKETTLVSEGGDREVNGKGTMICCEAVELQRNPELSKEVIEKELLKVLGQKKLIWVKQGPREDDKCTRGPIAEKTYTPTITGGHVDEFCRFVDAQTILLAEVSPQERDANPISAISYKRLEETCEILKKATDQDGRSFRIVRIPAPDHIYNHYTLKENGNPFALKYFMGTKPGDTIKYTLAASYLNFIISNGVIVMPSYWKKGRPKSMRIKDKKAKAIIENLFPGRKVIQVNPEAINNGGGGMHCITQHQPVKQTKEKSAKKLE